MATDALTVTGDYTTGGSLLLDAALGGPTSATDTLTVNGTIINSGTPTTITLRRIAGSGALTTGKGILVVSAKGVSPSNAFVLAGGDMRVGNFIYKLVQDNDGSWYLRSTEIPSPVPSVSVVPGAPNTGSAPQSSLPSILSILACLFVSGAMLHMCVRSTRE